MKIHLITYGDSKYDMAKKRLCNEAKTTGWFDSITAYGPDDLLLGFKSRFEEILRLPRGGGYWIWKSHLIQKRLSEIEANDILVYLDAGCKVNKNGAQRFYEYLRMINESDKGILSFQMSQHAENKWTTRQIFDYFNVKNDSDVTHSGQLVGTLILMKNIRNTKKLFTTVLQCLNDNPLLFTDHYNNNQEPSFQDNRHDQSILSVTRKIQGTIVIEDETYFPNFKCEKASRIPFLATRLRG